MSLLQHFFSAERAEHMNGQKLSIAFLDTGISPVADFILPQNRIVAFRDLVGGKTVPYDDNGHGTHVTGAKPYLSGNKKIPLRLLMPEWYFFRFLK